jgi:hypothetical protein
MKRFLPIAVVLTAICTLEVHADATLTFELDGPEMEPQTKIISLARFFARIDDPAKPDNYLLYQAGKFFPLYRVDLPNRSYSLLTPEVKPTLHADPKPEPKAEKTEPPAPDTPQAATDDAESPAASDSPANDEDPQTPPAAGATAGATQPSSDEPAPASPAEAEPVPPQTEPQSTSLHLTPKSRKIAGVECRVVEELLDDKPIIRHCMADRARLGITEREIRSLARTFKMARERDLGWLATATKDEKFVSVASEDLRNQKTLMLKTVSTKPLPTGQLRIPRDFTKTPKQ